ncbi:MAG: hypothetical protein DHS20C18_55870 [Saprospiraceae bacterium]|nr:MAG: hypothetical protein DHS20C18_55870 [Saprospiraceae bacterium]
MDVEKPFLKVVFCCLFIVFTSLSSFAAIPPRNDKDSTNVNLEKQTYLRNLIVEEARQYLGLRYRYGGYQPETGFDCSGFTAYLMGMYSIPLAHSSRVQAQLGQEVSLEQVQAGDLIAFRRSRKRAVSHVAMVVDNNEEGLFIIHSTSRGIVIDNLNDSRYWQPKVYVARDIISEVDLDQALPDFLEKQKKKIDKMPLLKRLPVINYASVVSEAGAF